MHSTDPTFPLYPILSFLAFVVSFIPFPWHFRAGNIGTCAYMISTGVYSLVEFINSLVWAGNVNNVAPVWCDISAQIIIGASIGIPASTLAISRQLYGITATQGHSATPDEKRRNAMIDLAIVLGLPVLVMVLHVVVQPNRFNILENVGCKPATFNTLAAYFLFFMWPILIGVCSFIYSALTLRRFYFKRLQFNQMKPANSSLKASPYLRLMLLVFVDMLCNTPLGVFAIIVATRTALEPFSSWSDTHDFTLVRFIPASEWQSDRVERVSIEINHWLPVFCSFVFFVFFGFAEEAKKNYDLGFQWVCNKLGIQRKTPVHSKGLAMNAIPPRPPVVAHFTGDSQQTLTNATTPKFIPFQSPVDMNAPFTPDTSFSCASSTRPLITAPGSMYHSYQPSRSSFHTIDLNDEPPPLENEVAYPPAPTYQSYYLQSLRPL